MEYLTQSLWNMLMLHLNDEHAVESVRQKYENQYNDMLMSHDDSSIRVMCAYVWAFESC